MHTKLALLAASLGLVLYSSDLLADQPQREPDATLIMGPIKKLPNNGRPANRTEFPEIKNWNSLRIILKRGMCLGTCPSYSVEIDGDGTVIYQGDEYVAIKGRQVDHIPEQTVRDLFAQFHKAEYFWSLDEYAASITDFPAFSTSIEFDGRKKTVGDYAGGMVGMPSELMALEDAIDRAAGTDKWIGHSQTP